jgi:RNA polymerase II subunit A small phosphatase-like protein
MCCEVSSIITQVDRNAPVAQTTRIMTPPIRSQPALPSQRRSFFSRLLCCAPKAGAGAGQISVVPSHHTDSHKRTTTVELSAKSHLTLDGTLLHRAKKCLALDLDETLVHSSFQPVKCASFTISVVIDGITHKIFVMKRPGVDQFLQRLAEHYELVIYTASLSKYADPLLDILDPTKLISRRLFRENCVFYDSHYVKDLSLLGRDISQTIIIDNCPNSYSFQPENAIDCSSFFDDPADIELWAIADFLEYIRGCDDVRAYCRSWKEWCKHNTASLVPLRFSYS